MEQTIRPGKDAREEKKTQRPVAEAHAAAIGFVGKTVRVKY